MDTGVRVAALSGLVYLALAGVAGGRLPFVERQMFSFPILEGPVAVPLFRADGELARYADYVDFSGLPPSTVDVVHAGYQSSVEQHFFEQRSWIAEHQAAAGASPGPVSVEVGLILLEQVDGQVTVRHRIDARGAAHQRAP